MRFPLGDWIDDHPGLPYDLAQSGVGPTLRTVRAALRRPEVGDEEALRNELAKGLGVDAERLFLTHGATEANGLALTFLAARRRGGARPRCAIPSPEYPPLGAAARALGYRLVTSSEPSDVVALSDPNNPTGLRASVEELDRRVAKARAVLVDETFREFTRAPTRLSERRPGLWVSGTFTKVYGGDALRVGYLVVPEPEVEAFGALHAVATDRVATASVAAARALLRDRSPILAEVRARFEANLSVLREAVPELPPLEGPVWLDRRGASFDADAAASRLLERGVLVCSGSFFGDPTGLRLSLTRPTFPRSLRVYLEALPRAAGSAARRSATGAAAVRRR